MVIENMSLSSEHALRTAFDCVKEGIAVIDLNGIIVDVNNGLLDLFGYQDKSPLIGTEFIRLVITQERPYVNENLKQIYENIVETYHEYTLVRADGGRFAGGLKIRSIRNADGKPSGYVMVISDYSEREIIREDILIAEQHFRYTLDNSPMGIVIVSSENELLYANKSVLNIYGYDSVEELETTPPSVRFTPKSYFEFRERQNNRQTGKSIPHTYEVCIIRKDGKIRHLMAFRQPIIWNGEVCNQISYNDITEIKESEELHRALADNSPVGVYIMQNGKFCYANAKFAKLSGFSLEELLEMNPKEFIYPDDIDYVQESAVRMLKDDIIDSYEFRYINRRGDIHWAIESVSSISYSGKRATLGIFMDITDHRNMVEELNYSDASLRSIHEGVYTMDNEFRITRWNSVCEEMFGIMESDAAGKYIWEVLEMVEDYPGQNQDRIDLLFKQGYNKEEQILRYPNGEIWADVFAQAVEANGERLGWVTIISDISERKSMENALRESEANYRSVVESADIGIIVLQDGKVVISNPYLGKILDYTEEEVNELGFISTIHPDDREITSTAIQRRLRGEESSRNLELRLITKSGRIKWIETSSVLIQWNGKPAVQAFVLDISERKRMEKELRESEQYMRSLINSLEDLVFTYDLEGHYGPFYKASQDIQGYLDDSNIQFIGVHYSNILPSHVADKLDIAFESVKRTGNNTDFDYSVVFGETDRWYNAKVSPIRNESGEFSEILVVSRDITERKRMEAELQESEEHVRSLLNSMDDLVFSFDMNGLFKNFYQPANEPDLLVNVDKFVGSNYCEVLPVDISKKLNSAITSLIKSREHQQFDYCIEPADELLWYNARISPVTDMSGEIIGITVVSRNITERKHMEEMINRAAKEWETTFNAMFESIYIIDKSYRVAKTNKSFCDYYNMDSPDIIGKYCYQVIHGRNTPCPQCVIPEVLETGKPVFREFNLEITNKSLQAVATPIIAENQEISGFIITTRDVTEKLKLAEQLKQSQLLASLGTMTAGIAHEVNNPLGSVLLLSELLLRDDNVSHIKKDLRVIHSEAKRAAKIMSTLLTYRNNHTPSTRRLNLNRIIKRVLDIRQYHQSVLNIKAKANLSETPVYVKGDYSQLTQVFINVLMNSEEALKKMGEGKIVIDVSGGQDWATISIADNGTGIPEENLEKVFHPFFTTKKVGEGTGLGLSTCYSIVTSHNGLIHAENNDMGGVTITVELPVIRQKVKKRKYTHAN